jgi:hypothetical protein
VHIRKKNSVLELEDNRTRLVVEVISRSSHSPLKKKYTLFFCLEQKL